MVKYNIVAVLEHYGGQVPHRPGEAKMRCPFHDDTHPSATVNITRGWFHCFACGFYGDSIDVIRWREGAGYADAKRQAEEVTGESDNQLRAESAAGENLFGASGHQLRDSAGVASWRSAFP